MNTETNAKTVYFTARNGKVMSYGSDSDRREAQMYVTRNNAYAARRGDESKPYSVLAYNIPTSGGE